MASKPLLANRSRCRRDRHQDDPAGADGVRLARQQHVHAQCQPLGEETGQRQRLPLLVRVDHSAQDRVVHRGRDRDRESVGARNWSGEEGTSAGELLTTARADAPPGLPAAMASGAEQQVTRCRQPMLKAHRLSLPRPDFRIGLRWAICGQSVDHLAGIGDGADLILSTKGSH